MKVSIVCFGLMRDHLPPGTVGNRAVLDVPDDATVRAVATALGAPVGKVYAVLVDGEQADLDAPLHDGAEVSLLPPFTGG